MSTSSTSPQLQHKRHAYGSDFVSSPCHKFPAEQCKLCDAQKDRQACNWLRNDPKLAGCMNSAGVPIYWNRRIPKEDRKAKGLTSHSPARLTRPARLARLAHLTTA